MFYLRLCICLNSICLQPTSPRGRGVLLACSVVLLPEALRSSLTFCRSNHTASEPQTWGVKRLGHHDVFLSCAPHMVVFCAVPSIGTGSLTLSSEPVHPEAEQLPRATWLVRGGDQIQTLVQLSPEPDLATRHSVPFC